MKKPKEFTKKELEELKKHLDDETEWVNMDGFWDAWGPRINDRIKILIEMALKNAK